MILGFKQQFVPAVANGTKPHSIRADMRWREGMSIQFYENVRQPTMRIIRPDAVALVVQRLCIYPTVRSGQEPTTVVDGLILSPADSELLAQRDGFPNYSKMISWFAETHGLPFTGKLIIWQPGLRY